MRSVSRGIDRLVVTFDDSNLVANAGLLLVATLSRRLGLEALINDTVRLVGRTGGARPGRKLLTLVHAMCAGANHIDHVDVLRAGATRKVLGHVVMAPSTIGTFLRAFTFGHVRQLDKLLAEALARAWAAGAGPAEGAELVVDIDSTICEVHGNHKHGASYGYTRHLGYHPILATRADTGEVVFARQRKGSANTARGVRRFIAELVAVVRRAGAAGPLVVRADSGYWSYKTIATLKRLGVGYSIAVAAANKAIQAAIAKIDDDAWVDIVYPDGGTAQVADCTYKNMRLVVRRTRLVGDQAQLWPDWRHHAFLTDRQGDAVDVDRFHRSHARVELAIRDLKEGAGLEHTPSGDFAANGAWLCAAVLAHNLMRWTHTLGELDTDTRFLVVKTLRARYLSIPGRVVNDSGTPTLRMPSHWPWADQFERAVEAIRDRPYAPT